MITKKFQKLFLNYLYITAFMFAKGVSAQCPAPPFTVQDTACPLQSLSFDNPPAAALQYNWDFCTGDLHNSPTYSSITIPAGFTAYPEQFSLVKENGSYFGFIANNGLNYLTRISFGNSLNAMPQFDTLYHDPLLAGMTGIDLVKENGKWIAFVIVPSPARMVRLDFDSITQLNPQVVNTGAGGLSTPLLLDVKDHYAFVSDLSGAVLRYDFGNDYQNIPTQVLPSITLSTPFGIEIIDDCNTGKYYVVVASSANSTINVFDLGNNLANAPAALTPFPMASPPRALSIAKENNEWFMATVSSDNKFRLSSFGSSLENTPSVLSDTLFTGAFTTSFSCKLIKDSSQWHCFAVNVDAWQVLSHVIFPDNCNASVSYSSDAIPAGVSLNASATGFNYIELTTLDTNNIYTIFPDSVFISIPPPVAAFAAGPACENTVVNFFDSSYLCYGSLTAWQWEFGDGDISMLQNPAHLYASTGSYAVTLTVFAANGDSSVFTDTVTVVPYPVSSFNFVNNTCAGQGVPFTDLSTTASGSITSWQWNFGDGGSDTLQNPVYIYSSGGSYSATLTAINSSGCADTSTMLVTVQSSPVPAFTFIHTCNNENTQFINLTDSAGLSDVAYNWQFGDSQTSASVSPQHIYPSGSYLVNLTATGINGCSDSVSHPLTVSEKPQPSFMMSQSTGCTDETIDFTDNSTSADSIIYYHWDFGDGTGADSVASTGHAYSTAGNYTITLTIATASYCDTSVTQNVLIVQSPAADFTSSNSCFGTPVTFTNTSIPAPGDTISAFYWDFGDSTSSGAADTSHQYASPGNYSVMLIATSVAGCTDTTIANATVFENPVADFTNYPLLCTDTSALFIDLSSVNNDTISSWSWDFGDGNTSIVQNPAHIYTQPGIKLVTLTVTTNNQCTATISKVINIHQSPSPTVNYTPSCFGDLTCFTASDGNNPPDSIASWQWNFGDSALSIIQNPCHAYAYSGIFNLTLQAIDTNGCRTARQVPVTVHPLPQAAFSYSQPCAGQNISFSDSSIVSAGSITSWNWNFNNAANSGLQNPVFSTMTTGLVPVSLLVSTDNGCTDSIVEYIQVDASPVAQFTITPVFSAPGQMITLGNQSSNAVAYQWNFGDGSQVDTTSATTHVYADTGAFTVSLIAQSSNGCIDTTQKLHLVVIPDADIAVMDVNTANQNGLLTITATLFNSSNVDITSFEIIADVDGMNAIHEHPQLYIPISSAPKIYQFQSSISVGSRSPSFVCVEARSPNGLPDSDVSNNMMCKSLGSALEIMSVSPNPVGNEAEVTFNMPVKGNAILTIVNAAGAKIFETEIAASKGYNSLQLSTISLKQGAYSLLLRSDDEVKVHRFVK